VRARLAQPRHLAVFPLACLLLVACDADRGGYSVVNGTDRPVDIFYVESGQERILYRGIGPGKSAWLVSPLTKPADCTEGDLVARDLRGTEVARRSEPVCNGGTWEIAD
jgi:hypothetical protein